MGDLISREELMRFPIRWDHYDKENGREEFVAGIETVLEYAANLPSVDAEPVRRGRWILNETRIGLKTYRCNRNGCKDSPFWKERYCYGTENFCPNCGARMEG